jgi:hypothetical protein
LKGCGHSICRDCKNNLTKTNNQFVKKAFFAGRHSCTVISVKCPMCRAIEKDNHVVLQTFITILKAHVKDVESNLKDVEAKLLEKQVIEINLREQLRNQSRNPSTIPRVEVIDLVEPVRPPNPPVQRATNQNPLMFCQSAGCRSTKRTRSICRNHPGVPCCSRCIRCDQCR